MERSNGSGAFRPDRANRQPRVYHRKPSDALRQCQNLIGVLACVEFHRSRHVAPEKSNSLCNRVALLASATFGMQLCAADPFQVRVEFADSPANVSAGLLCQGRVRELNLQSVLCREKYSTVSASLRLRSAWAFLAASASAATVRR